MSFCHSLSVNRVNITKKSVARMAFVLISGLVIVAVIRSSWSSSSNVEVNDITSKWEQLFQTATNTVVDKLMSDPKRHQPNVNCQSTTDWDALLDSGTPFLRPVDRIGPRHYIHTDVVLYGQPQQILLSKLTTLFI